jgi:hypothetical protein
VGGGVGGIADGLASLPAPSGSEPLLVAYGDLAQAADLAGVDFTELEADSDDGEARDALNAVLGQASDGEEQAQIAAMAPEAAHVERVADIAAFVDEVGWHVFQVDRFVEYQVPPNNVTVMEGRFDEDRLTEALGEPEDGVWVVGDPDGDVDVSATSPARPIGEPLWLSLVDDDRLVVARTAEDMAAVQGEGDRGTLADDKTLTALAEALDAEDVYSALLHGGPLAADMTALPPEQLEQVCEETLPAPFIGVATGITSSDDGPVLVLAYVHADDEAAAANADALESLVQEGTSLRSQEPWSHTFEVDTIEADGNVTIARLSLTAEAHPGIWRQLILARENLVTAC